jgi:uncharacterized protein YdaU (DUF1376 family)
MVMHYYPHHIGDFNARTRHLSRLERSIYRDLIELYYETEAPISIDLDRVARRIVATSPQERAAMVDVLNEFFTPRPRGLVAQAVRGGARQVPPHERWRQSRR